MYKSSWDCSGIAPPEDLQRCLEIEGVLGAELPAYIQALSGMRSQQHLESIAYHNQDKDKGLIWALCGLSFVLGGIISAFFIFSHLPQ